MSRAVVHLFLMLVVWMAVAPLPCGGGMPPCGFGASARVRLSRLWRRLLGRRARVPSPSFPVTGSSGFRRVWEERFLRRPVGGLDDGRTHVELWLLSGREHRSSMLEVLLTDLMHTAIDDEGLLSSPPPAFLFRDRAAELKGAPLTDGERARALRFGARRRAGHVRGICLNRSFLPAYLHRTTGGEQRVGAALERIALREACVCDYGVSETATAEQALQVLNGGHAVLLERRGRVGWNPFAGDDGRWLLLFGSFTDGRGELRFLANVPEETTLMERYSWQRASHPSLESIDRCTISEMNYRRSKGTGFYNIRSNIENLICDNGFLALPASELGGYRLHALRHWRRSAEAWDGGLRRLLGLPAARPSGAGAEPPAGASAAEVWRHYFVERRGEAGLSYDGAALPRICLAEGGVEPLAAAVIAAAGASRPDFVAYGLSFPGRLFHASRLFLGDGLMLPRQEELDACVRLCGERLELFRRRFGQPPPEPVRWGDPGYSEDYDRRHRDGYRSPHSLSAHLAHSLPAILAGARDVRGAVGRLPAACGWSARVEGGPGTGWGTLRLAVWRGVPVILEGRGGEWRTAFGYLVRGGRRWLLATRGGRAAPPDGGAPRVRVHVLPAELPEGLELIEYDESRWTPWLVHRFAPTVEHLAPQVREIFRRHLEESPQKAQNRTRGESAKGTE